MQTNRTRFFTGAVAIAVSGWAFFKGVVQVAAVGEATPALGLTSPRKRGRDPRTPPRSPGGTIPVSFSILLQV